MRQVIRVAAVSMGVLALACSDPFLAEPGREYADVATGGEHTCAVTTEGEAWCWGRGTDGELGTGETGNRFKPARVESDVRFRSITAGDAHTCALADDGRVFCWGWSPFFQTGNGGSGTQLTPVPVFSEERFVKVSAGAHHACAIADDGRVFCWGHNRWGQAGNGTTDVTAFPIEVRGGLRAVAITSGGFHTCALTQSGDAYCWGSNDAGQLGIASDVPFVTEPVPVFTELGFTDLDAGGTHTCGVARDAIAWCWGGNAHGELGDGAAWRPGLAGPAAPVKVVLLEDVRRISAGTHHTCAVDGRGLTWCWGRGVYGQLGNGSTARDHPVRQPVYVQPTQLHRGDLVRFTVLATGGMTHACAMAEGAVYCWGTGRSGQLGTDETFVTMPRRVSD